MSAVVAHLRLLFDILSIKVFVWMLGRNDELLDSHLFCFEKYSDLADYHRRRDRIRKANRLASITEWHFQLAPDDDSPEAAAMAMPVPPRRIWTTASQALRAVGSANDRRRRDHRHPLKRSGGHLRERPSQTRAP